MPDPRRFIPGLHERTVAAPDGTPLAVQLIDDHGGTRPTLMLVNGLGGTVVTWAHLVRRFRHAFRMVSFDTRGLHGSGRPLGGAAALEVPVHAEDVVAVADAVGAERFHLLGWSMGVQVAIEAAWQLHRRGDAARVLSLGLHNGTAGRAFAEVLGQPLLGPAVDPLLRGLRRQDALLERVIAGLVHRPVLLQTLMRTGLVDEGVDRDVFGAAAAGFADLDAAVFLDILRGLGRHDAWHALPALDIPAVVVAGSRDLLTPLSTMRRMAAQLPRARLEVLERGTHYAAIEYMVPFHTALGRFWRDVGVAHIDVDDNESVEASRV